MLVKPCRTMDAMHSPSHLLSLPDKADIGPHLAVDLDVKQRSDVVAAQFRGERDILEAQVKPEILSPVGRRRFIAFPIIESASSCQLKPTQ